MPTAVFSFLTPSNVRSPEIARSFFELMNDKLNGASLGRFGESEPLLKDFDNDFDRACESWKRNVFWKGKRGSGAILHGSARRHTNLSFYFEPQHIDATTWARFVMSVSRLVTADFSSIHFFDGKSQTEEDEVLEGITSHDIQDAIPTIPWAGCFGKPYVDLIGMNRFDSAGFEVVEQITEDLVFFQLTSNPNDYVEDYETFRSRQDFVKSALGKNYFLGASEVVVPKFKF